MLDAFVGGWAQESLLSAEVLGSLRDLNHRFLDLAAARGGAWTPPGAGRALGLAARVGPLSAAQRAQAAACPYALFDLRFQDEAHWRSRLQNLQSWRVADETAGADSVGKDTLDFVRLALFYTWHVASNATLKAQLLLGMNAAIATELGRINVNHLPSLAASEAKHLSARWSDCTVFWNRLTGAASQDDGAALRRVQLYGLQLAAAARFPAP